MAMGSESVELKVLPEELIEKAQEVSGLAGCMAQLFETVQDIAHRTRYYWIGDAADTHRKALEGQRAEMEELLKRLREHPEDLRRIAAAYSQTEEALAEEAGQMPGNALN